MEKLKVGILGATGAAGNEFIIPLVEHPYFKIHSLHASSRSAGKTFEKACILDTSSLPEEIKQMKVRSLDDIDQEVDIVCSALPSEIAKKYEAIYAERFPVFSTTSAFRYEDDVPILITEINPEHCKLLPKQKERGWKGFVAPGPNCTTVGLVMSLKPIYDCFGIEEVVMSSYQSVSGGGKELIDFWRRQRRRKINEALEPEEIFEEVEKMIEGNVIGYIPKEVDKVKKETLKILGDYCIGKINDANINLECQCARVPVPKGHFETVFVKTKRKITKEKLIDVYNDFNDECSENYGALPSSPKKTITILDRSPQPYYDVNLDKGMTTVVGMIEETFNGIKYQVLSNNLSKGAAKGSIQVAELLYSKGLLKKDEGYK